MPPDNEIPLWLFLVLNFYCFVNLNIRGSVYRMVSLLQLYTVR